jgi:hypothetical protein
VQNWANWASQLPPGTYKWSVAYSGGVQSATRSFIVSSTAQAFVVPDMVTTVNNVMALPHPRSLPDAATLATLQNQRTNAVAQLLSDVSGHFNMVFPSQASSEDDVWTYTKYELASLMACVLSNRQASYCNDAIGKLMALGNWSVSTSDASSYFVHDMAGRYLDWALALGYDWLYPMLDAGQRATLLNAISSRTAGIYNDLIGSRARIAVQPRDSHGNQTLAYLPVIEAMVAGDLPIAGSTWLPNTLPLALNAINPWGGEEGGYQNSTTQGTWDMGESAFLFYELRLMTGIDVSKKPWVGNWAKWFAYFTPPGMPGGTTEFGDGYESNEAEHQARYGKAYTYFSPSPIGRWHMSLLNAEDPTRFEYLMAPPADFSGAQAFPAGTPNSLYLKSIGEVAMHSDLSDPGRVSVYFKSSPPPYGAYNHSHADQNGFVVNAGGQRLAIESGYYDGYKTQHWWNWYHQTLSKNAITYDGGKGQMFFDANNLMGYGKVTSFTTTAGYDVVTGDATQAYGGVLSLAQRSLIFLRPNLIVVYDNLAAPAAHSWEWNIHALNQMSSSSPTTATLQSGNQSLCVTMLAAPASTQFTQTNQFTSAPVGTWPLQWHGKFASGAQTAAEFVALMNVGCAPVTASALKSNGAWTVAVGGATITIAGGAISVTGAGTSTTTTGGSGTGSTGTTTGGGSGTGTTSGASAYAGTPYSGTPTALPGTVQAENFDLGGQNVAYYDTTPGNLGGQYRALEDVDLINSCDSAGGGYVVNNFATGEWLSYTVNATTSGSYVFQLRAANNYSNATPAFHIEVDGSKASASVPVPNTGGWCNFQTVPVPAFNLGAGKHVVRIVSDQGFFNLNSFTATATPATTTSAFMSTYKGLPFSGTPIGVPSTFMAANFDLGGQNVAYNDTTSTNVGGQYRPNEAVDIVATCDATPSAAYVVNNFATGEWLNYTINVPTAGNYVVQLRAANNYTSNVAFHIEVDGAKVAGPIAVPVTGAWCNFQPVAAPAIPLTAGTHVLRIVSDQQYFNLETIDVIASP